MAMLIIEGMDNSGKSTLASALAEYIGLGIQESEGPPLSDDEINERVDRYERMGDSFIFDRHPVTSNSIYGQVRPEGDPITLGRQLLFWEARPIIIYADAGTRGLDAHVKKAHDTEKHLADIETNYNKLLDLYRVFAAERAHFMYRIGDNVDALLYAVRSYKYYLEA